MCTSMIMARAAAIIHGAPPPSRLSIPSIGPSHCRKWNGDYLPTSPTSVIPAQAGIHLLQGAPSRLRKQSITPPSQNRWVNLGPHIPHLRHCRAEPAPYSDTGRESIGDYLLAASRAAVWHAPMGKIKRWWSILVGVEVVASIVGMLGISVPVGSVVTLLVAMDVPDWVLASGVIATTLVVSLGVLLVVSYRINKRRQEV